MAHQFTKEHLILHAVWRKAFNDGQLTIPVKSASDATRLRFSLYNADASFHDALEGTASACGQWIMRYLHEICSDDPALRARVYQDIFNCYSGVLDTDRQELTRAEVKRRYRHYKGCL